MSDKNRWYDVIDYDNAWRSKNNGDQEEKTISLGAYYDYTVKRDIKHLGFTLSRYKFVSKLLCYRQSVDILELGCNEGVGAEMLRQNVDLNKYVGIDLDEKSIEWNKKHFSDVFDFIKGDFFDEAVISNGRFMSDAVISLDVIEHIDKKQQDVFLKIITGNLKYGGVAVIGTPNITMTPYASEASKIGHVNLYDQKRLYALLNRYFDNVFIFGMNDEIVHTGFAPMACYIFAVCTGAKAI